MGHEVVWFRKECRHYTRDMELAMEMIQAVHRETAEAVVSFNYFPIVSMICQTCGIPYYAWVYDCPHFTLYAKQVGSPHNHIGIFDREMVRQLEGYGVQTAYHVPLAVDTEYFENVITHASSKEREKYRCDVSFVGSLYTDEHNYYDLLFPAQKEIMERVVTSQCFAYDQDYLRQALTSGQIDPADLLSPMEEHGLMLGEDYFAKPEDILLAAVLEKKVTVEERRTLLVGIAGQAAEWNGTSGSSRQNFRLYTGSDTGMLPMLHAYNRGMVDYHTQMPLVFAGSRINLNITLRSIHSGIPLRVLDIMACGGFVLSNRQPEIAEYFEEGKEIVTFGSMEECFDKIRYYLAHEEERRKIAESGLRKVEAKFSYATGLTKLFAGKPRIFV